MDNVPAECVLMEHAKVEITLSMFPRQAPRFRTHTPFRLLLCALLLSAPSMLLAGCSDSAPQATFAPLHYEFLSQFHFNVGSLSIADNSPPGTVPGDISGRSPVTPDQALQQMAHDRLAAAGSAGTAIFSIDQASILHQAGGELVGTLDVHVDIITPTGQHAGFAQAKVTRNFKPDSDTGDADNPASLYTLTSQMMQDMNVELEFQLRRSLKDWLVDAGGAPVAGAIEQQNLGAPSGDASAPMPVATPPATSPAADAPPASASVEPPKPAVVTPQEPDAVFPTGLPGTSGSSSTTPDSTAPAKGTSPQPGVLKLPDAQETTSSTSSTTTGTSGY